MRRAYNFSLQPEDHDKLISLCEEMGAAWGNRPAISTLLRWIARGEVSITKKPHRGAGL